MRVLTPVQSILIADCVKNPHPKRWERIERAGRITLSIYARKRIIEAVKIYIGTHEAAKKSPSARDVHDLLSTIARGAEAILDGSDSLALQKAIETLLNDTEVSLAALTLWTEGSEVSPSSELVKLYAGAPVDPERVGLIVTAAESAIQLAKDEQRGQRHGPRSLREPEVEFLDFIIPLYRRRGGKIEYYDDEITGPGGAEATPLVVFVHEICNQLIPEDWPARDELVSTISSWSKRIKKQRLGRPS